MTQEQSPGALRAAEQIKDYFLRYPHTTIKEIAIVIDRETGASDLLSSAENIFSNLDDDETLKRRSRDQLIFKCSVIRQLLKSAITNMKGESK